MKKISIESLLQWTYRQELPKAAPISPMLPPGFGFAWGGVANYGKYLTNVQEPDVRNRFGLAPDFAAQTEPHPDAVRTWAAVQDLDNFSVALPEDWDPLADMGDLGSLGRAAVAKGLGKIFLPTKSETKTARQVTPRSAVIDTVVEAELRMMIKPVSEIMQTAAILNPPTWRGEKPELCREKTSDGRPRWYKRSIVVTETGSFEIEVDGYDYKKGRPYPDAYPRELLDPDPTETVEHRAKYRIWFDALGHLVAELAGRLDEHDVVATTLSAEPWIDGGPPAPRILVDLRDPQPTIGGGRHKLRRMRSAA